MHDFGMILKDCSIEEIMRSVQIVSNLPAEKLKNMARKAWEYARANHTRERFAEEYKKAILKIITNYSSKESLSEEDSIKQDVSKYQFTT